VIAPENRHLDGDDVGPGGEVVRHRHGRANGRRSASERLLGLVPRLVPEALLPRYVMCPAELQQISAEVVARFPLAPGGDREARRKQMFSALIDRLATTYPGYIDRKPDWFLIRCGGAEFTIGLLYVAPHEYALLCGSNVGIVGADSGCYHADVWDFILEGENYNASADPFEPVEVTRAGEYTFLGQGERKIWSTSAPCWMIDYGRGLIPGMVGHGLLETLSVLGNVRATRQFGSAFLAKLMQSGQQWLREM
jgi:C-8 sterol isomerase